MPSPQRFFLGVDAGASKTHAVVLSSEGSIVGFGEGPCGNHEVNGFAGTQASVRRSLEGALASAGLELSRIERAVFCMAGVDVPSDSVEIPKQVLDPLLNGLPYLLKNDAYGCLRGGTLDPFGVMINCGSGQVAVGRNRAGMEIRVGGYGWEFGDYAGGNVIMHSAVAAMIRAVDGRAEPTALVDMILQSSGHPTVEAFLERGYRDLAYIWSLGIPKLVFRASLQGDAVARRILLSVAEEMAFTAIALIQRLAMESETFDLVTAGSVFKGEDPIFNETIQDKVHQIAPGACFRAPLYPPVVGAGLLAYEWGGLLADESCYSNLGRTMGSLRQEG